MTAEQILEGAVARAKARDEKLKLYTQLRLDKADRDYLDRMMRLGRHTNRASFLRSIMRTLIADDKAAEGAK